MVMMLLVTLKIVWNVVSDWRVLSFCCHCKIFANCKAWEHRFQRWLNCRSPTKAHWGWFNSGVCYILLNAHSSEFLSVCWWCHVIYITSKIYFNFGSPFVSLIWIELKRKCIYYFKSATNHGILYHPSKADNLWIEARVLYPTPNILFDGKREIPEASRIP